ncbi:hypothetical protein ACWEQL_24035 [Kitasatospora sp. NPDC004240]
MRILSTWSLAGTPNDRVPAGLAESCARVGRDLLRTIPQSLPDGVRWMLAEDDHGDARAPVVGWYADDEPQFGRSIDLGLTPASLTRFVAELVQDRLTGYEFIQWPECPGHTHPMEPGADAAGAWWRCRTSRGAVDPIGDLVGPVGRTDG